MELNSLSQRQATVSLELGSNIVTNNCVKRWLSATLSIVFFPIGVVWGSETNNGYAILGLISSVASFVFFFIFWWLFSKIRGVGVWQVSIYVLSVILIIPCGFTYLYGSIFPNWAIFLEGGHISEISFFTNFCIFIANTLIFMLTRAERKSKKY